MKKETTKRIVTKLKHPLPSYGIAFEKHFEIIKAYVIASEEGKKPISWKNFQKLVSVSSYYVSANNKFLEDLGLIRRMEKNMESIIRLKKLWNFQKLMIGTKNMLKIFLEKLFQALGFGKLPNNC